MQIQNREILMWNHTKQKYLSGTSCICGRVARVILPCWSSYFVCLVVSLVYMPAQVGGFDLKTKNHNISIGEKIIQFDLTKISRWRYKAVCWPRTVLYCLTLKVLSSLEQFWKTSKSGANVCSDCQSSTREYVTAQIQAGSIVFTVTFSPPDRERGIFVTVVLTCM